MNPASFALILFNRDGWGVLIFGVTAMLLYSPTGCLKTLTLSLARQGLSEA